MRAIATSKAKPTLASQAENVSRSKGVAKELIELKWRVHKERPINRESIIPSRHSKADRRWVR